MKRRPTVELRDVIKSQRNPVLPPPAPAGTSLREWFAGVALGNPSLMQGIDDDAREAEAVRIADALIGALSAPRVPSKASLAPPSAKSLAMWATDLSRSRQTVPDMRSPAPPRVVRATVPDARSRRLAITAPALFTPEHRDSIPPPMMITRPALGAGRYSGTLKDD